MKIDLDALGKIANQAFRASESATQELINASHPYGGMPAAINVIGNYMVAGIHTMCMAVGKHIPPSTPEEMEDFNPLDVICPETLLFSALLINKMSPDYDRKRHGGDITLSPVIILDALESYEKLTGKAPDEYLNEALVKAARDVGAVGAVPFKDFMERMKNAPEGPTSIN